MSSFFETHVSDRGTGSYNPNTEALFQEEPTEDLEPPLSRYNKLRLFLKLCWGGALFGSFLGVFVGAACGIIYGLRVDDLSYGLDGAFVGSAICAVVGLLYGVYCGISDLLRRDPIATG